MNPNGRTRQTLPDDRLAAAGAAGGESAPSRPAGNAESCQVHMVSARQEIIDNLPYAAMVLLGTAVLLAGIDHRLWRWLLGGLYLAYGAAGAVWVMLFICPHCHFYDTRLCPCGYGRVAARLRQRKDPSRFARQFKRHIPVIVPLWVIPLVAGVIALLQRPGVWLAILLALFAINSYLVLPLVSKRYGCARCPQKDNCPWMAGAGVFSKRRSAGQGRPGRRQVEAADRSV